MCVLCVDQKSKMATNAAQSLTKEPMWEWIKKNLKTKWK